MSVTRAYTYSFQPDILVQIREARALTPPEVLAAQERAKRRTNTVVADRIARLNLVPFDDSPPPEGYSSLIVPHEQPHSARLSTDGIAGLPTGRPALSALLTRASSSSSNDSSRHRLHATSGPNPQTTSNLSNSSTLSADSTTMSRPTSSHNRPTHIPLPSGGFTGRSPNGSPLNAPVSPASPRGSSSFIPSFMRTRARAATLSNRAASPSVEAGNPISANTPSRGQSGQDQSTNGTPSAGSAINRSVSTPLSGSGSLAQASMEPSAATPSDSADLSVPAGTVKTHRIRLVPALENSRSLAFDPVVRELMSIYVPPGTSPSVAAASITNTGPAINGRPPALLLKIGRFTEKNPSIGAAATAAASGAGASGAASGSGAAAGAAPAVSGPTLTIAGGGGDVCSNKVAFKSKVVSRAHAEIWCENGGKFYIRDTSSSSGTFLNHIRLSSPNTESRPTMLNDGDILQLGVDYQGGHEDMFRCVKMRVEVGREWQRAANEFNTNALKQLKALGGGGVGTPTKAPDSPVNGSAKKGKTNVTDCCICLFSVTVCQSLFIAPCSHVFHYKCIRPLLMQHHPGFSCPLCRTFANLEEDVETEDAWEVASRRASVLSRKPSNHSIRLPPTSDRAPPHPGSDAPNGQPSTSVGFGPAGRSVDELLAADNASSSSESAAMAGSATLHRHTTAVQDSANASGDIDMPQAVLEADETGDGITNLNPFLAPQAGSAQPRSIPVPPVDPFAGPMSDAQTPMNDTFLSTLAPSVHQRLDLANQIAEVGRAAEPLPEEEPAAGEDLNAVRRNSDDEWMDVDRDGREGTVDMDESTRVAEGRGAAAA